MDTILIDTITAEELGGEVEFYNKHYITVDELGRITDGWSDGPHPGRDTTGAICINEGGYQFRLYPDGEENPSLYDWNHMIPFYKYENGEVIRRTQEEIDADIAAIPVPVPEPAETERLRADVDYLAIMMGVEL